MYEHDASEFKPSEAQLLEERMGDAWDRFMVDIRELISGLILDIGDEYRAPGDDDSDEPSMQLTVGHDMAKCAHDPAYVEQCWTYQTGDNSFSGGCYHKPHWAVVTLTRDLDPSDVAEDIMEQLVEAYHE